jgi:hypothetical protein
MWHDYALRLQGIQWAYREISPADVSGTMLTRMQGIQWAYREISPADVSGTMLTRMVTVASIWNSDDLFVRDEAMSGQLIRDRV